MNNVCRSAAAVTAALLTLAVASACSSATAPLTAASPTTAAITGPPAFTADQATWAMPLDDYRLDVIRLQHASDVAYATCMTAHGYATSAVDVSATIPSTRNRVLYSLFDVGIAQRYGYHAGPAPDPTARSGPVAVPDSDAGRAQATSCTAAVQDTLHVDSDAMARAQDLALQARSQAEADPGVVAAAGRWTTCMAPLAVADLPAQPVEMPSDSQRARFHAENVHVAGSDITRASADEIARAVVDARCRESSGYAAGLYRTEVAAQLRLVAGDPAGLATVLATNRRTTAAVDAVLAAG